MSNAVFPALLGLQPDVGRHPLFHTGIQTAVDGSEVRNAYQAYPLWKFQLRFEFLRDDATNNELNKLMALYLVMRGCWDNFLYTDPDNCQATDWNFANCDGVKTAFQLTRRITDGSLTFIEPVENPNVVTNVKRAGSLLTLGTDYTVGATGIVTTASTGTNGQALTWTGTYYNRCRFLSDEGGFDKFMAKLWKMGACEFLGAPGNKV